MDRDSRPARTARAIQSGDVLKQVGQISEWMTPEVQANGSMEKGSEWIFNCLPGNRHGHFDHKIQRGQPKSEPLAKNRAHLMGPPPENSYILKLKDCWPPSLDPRQGIGGTSVRGQFWLLGRGHERHDALAPRRPEPHRGLRRYEKKMADSRSSTLKFLWEPPGPGREAKDYQRQSINWDRVEGYLQGPGASALRCSSIIYYCDKSQRATDGWWNEGSKNAGAGAGAGGFGMPAEAR